MSILIVFLPLFSFFTAMLFSRFFGASGICFISTFSMFGSLFLALLNFVQFVLYGTKIFYVPLFTWFDVALFTSQYSFFTMGYQQLCQL